MLAALLQLAVGLALLTAGGIFLVRGATAVALLARVSTTVIGLTVVAAGTSLPELAVSVDAARIGSTAMAYGNVVGSNIFNIAVVLSLAALISNIPVTRQTFRIEYPYLILTTVLAILLARDGLYDRIEAFFALTLLTVFTAYLIRHERKIVPDVERDELREAVERTSRVDSARKVWLTNLGFITAGIILLPAGARLMVEGGVHIAQVLGVGERIVGLTILAIGTSLPEVATVIVAAKHNQPGLVLGNVIGSNIFNLQAVLGTTSAIYPVVIEQSARSYDNWVMLGFTLLLLPLMLTRRQIGKVDASALILLFVAYNWFLLR